LQQKAQRPLILIGFVQERKPENRHDKHLNQKPMSLPKQQQRNQKWIAFKYIKNGNNYI